VNKERDQKRKTRASAVCCDVTTMTRRRTALLHFTASRTDYHVVWTGQWIVCKSSRRRCR